MDPLTRLKMKQQREMQHLMEYEKLMREKEYKNNLRLKMQNEKLHKIEEKQKKHKEMIELKAKMYQSNLERTLATSQQIEQSVFQKNTSKVHRTLEILEKYETKYYPEQLNSIHSKAKSHQTSIEHAKKVRENLENSKLHDLSQSLDLRFKRSMEVCNNNNQGLSDRHKQEAMKNESYMRLVEQQQKKLQKERERKGKRFDEKIEKISKLQEEKERVQKEKQLMRLEQQRQREQMVNEFQNELMKLKEKQIKLKLQV